MTRPQHLCVFGLLVVVMYLAAVVNLNAQSMRPLQMTAESLSIELPWNDPIVTVHEVRKGSSALFISRHGTVWLWKNGVSVASFVTAMRVDDIKDAALSSEGDVFVAVHASSIALYSYPDGGPPLLTLPTDSILYVEKDDPTLLVIHTVTGVIGFDLERLVTTDIPYLPDSYVRMSHGKGLTVWSDKNHIVYRDTGAGPEVFRQYADVIDLSVDEGSVAVLSRYGDPSAGTYAVEIFLADGSLQQQLIEDLNPGSPARLILQGSTFALASVNARFGGWFLRVWSFNHPDIERPWIRLTRDANSSSEIASDRYELGWFALTPVFFLHTRGSRGPWSDKGSSTFIRATYADGYMTNRQIKTLRLDLARADNRSVWITHRVPKDVHLDPNFVPDLEFLRYDLDSREITGDDRWRLPWNQAVRDMYGFSEGVVVRCSTDQTYRVDTAGIEFLFDDTIMKWSPSRRGLYVLLRSEGQPRTYTGLYSRDGFRTYRDGFMYGDLLGIDDRFYGDNNDLFRRHFSVQNEEKRWWSYRLCEPFDTVGKDHVVKGPYADWCCYTLLVSDPDRSNTRAWIYDLNCDQVKAFDVMHPSRGPVMAEITVPRLERFLGTWKEGGDIGWLLTDGQTWEFTEPTPLASADSVIMLSDYRFIVMNSQSSYTHVSLRPQVTSVEEETATQDQPNPPMRLAIRAYDSYVWRHDLVNAEVTVWDVNGRQHSGAVLESSDGISRVQIGDRGLFLLRASTGRATRTQVLLVY